MQQEKPLLCRIETFSAVKVRYLRCNTIMHECDSFFWCWRKRAAWICKPSIKQSNGVFGFDYTVFLGPLRQAIICFLTRSHSGHIFARLDLIRSRKTKKANSVSWNSLSSTTKHRCRRVCNKENTVLILRISIVVPCEWDGWLTTASITLLVFFLSTKLLLLTFSHLFRMNSHHDLPLFLLQTRWSSPCPACLHLKVLSFRHSKPFETVSHWYSSSDVLTFYCYSELASCHPLLNNES